MAMENPPFIYTYIIYTTYIYIYIVYVIIRIYIYIHTYIYYTRVCIYIYGCPIFIPLKKKLCKGFSIAIFWLMANPCLCQVRGSSQVHSLQGSTVARRRRRLSEDTWGYKPVGIFTGYNWDIWCIYIYVCVSNNMIVSVYPKMRYNHHHFLAISRRNIMSNHQQI